ncbi:Di-copper centre-containing protein [Coniochaeta ligniaria NRRL 30616]|uniref:Di-copper centre-containing protein n=1 Tax=Coniochaeta ligniaria NRRL 30616 TaxID=1408157 RepID=A0A1J7K205_9PEZI|nr:Di-copper centre-containing protein [Coniochaeta ligniaria NRRL 30616]
MLLTDNCPFGRRTLSSKEKLSFIAAIKCMQAKPAKTTFKFPGSVSRYDDYQALHISQTDYIHFDGLFLPWHRYMLYLFEGELRSTCGYSGTIPYWNWSLDASSGEANVLKSPIFDPVYGFGGNGPYIADISSFPDDWKTIVDIPGRQGGGCITDGPFKDRQIPMGPANHTEYTPHCLRRDISPWLITQTANSSVLYWALQATSHWDLDHRIEGLSLAVSGMTLHAAGHLGVGGMIGDMANMYSSPGDPLFYLHHSMLDHVWDTWQRKKWPARKTDIGGPDTMWAYPYNYFGDIPYSNVTLQTPLNYGLIASTIKINDVMDTQGGQLCYTYA